MSSARPAQGRQPLWVAAQGIAAIGLALLLIAPLLVLFSAALYPPGVNPLPGQWWPDEPGWAALHRAWSLAQMGDALAHSLLLSLLGTAATLVVASLGGLGLHLCSPGWRRLWLLLLVLAATVPYISLWLPRFLLFRSLGLHDSLLPLLAPALNGANPLFVLLYYLSIRQIATEQFDAARLEGMGAVALWWRVSLPQVQATTLAVGVLSFAWFWGNTLDALIYLRNDSWTTAPLALLGLELLGSGELSVWLAGAALLALPLLGLLLLILPWLKTLEKPL